MTFDQTIINWKNLSTSDKERIIDKAREMHDEYQYINDSIDYEIQCEYEEEIEKIRNQLSLYGIKEVEIYSNLAYSNDLGFHFRVKKADVYTFLASMNRDNFFNGIFGMPGTAKEMVLKEYLSSYRLVSRQTELNIEKVNGPYMLVLNDYNDERIFERMSPEIKSWCEEWSRKFDDEKSCFHELNVWYQEFCDNASKKINKIYDKSEISINRLYHNVLNKLDEEDGLYFLKSGNELIPTDYSTIDFSSMSIQ